MKHLHRLQGTLMLLAVVSLVGCSSPLGQSATPTPATYTDPFAYCAAVGTVDAPDERYTGPAMTEDIAKGLQEAMNVPDTPLDMLMGGTTWRCVDGQVYACFVGANLPCDAKMSTDRTPTQEEIDFCQENPNAEVIPAAVTGRETVYEWRCTNGEPEIVSQVYQVDAQGFRSDIWYPVSPPSE